MGSKKTAHSARSAHSRKRVVGLTLAVACAATAAIVIAARRPAQLLTPGSETAAMQPDTMTAETRTAKVAVRETPEETPAATLSDAPAAKAQTTEKESKLLVQESVVTGPVLVMPAVTVNGCLGRDGNGFLLTDTDGANAPKARSWK